MQITFDTTTITDDEVRGIFALLDTVRPAAFDPGPLDAEEVKKAVEEKLADAGISVTRDENGNTVTTVSADQFVLLKNEGAPFTMEGGNSTFDGEEFPQSPVPPTTDANGLPWDERIHSGTKALNADGTWRTKRGVDKALVAEVEAELRQGPTPSEVAENLRNEGVEAEAISGEIHISAPPAPPAPPAPNVAIVQHTSAPEPVVNETHVTIPATTSPFVTLMKRVTTAQGAGKLTAQRVKELLESLDKKSIMDLRTDTDALDAFAVLLDGEGV